MEVSIREGLGGWIVYLEGNMDRFYAFKSDETIKMLEFVGKLIEGKKVEVKIK